VEDALRIRRDVQAVIFCDFDGEERFLLVKKLDFSARKYRWRLLKGGIQIGETEIEALRREIFEEVGLENVQVLGKIYSYQFTFKNVRHLVSTYRVKANPHERIKLQKSEIVSYIWVPKQRAIRMLYWKNEKKALAS
jgi:8-oxo-dGTP pyrophosphatase MutT (NUDIX family)